MRVLVDEPLSAARASRVARQVAEHVGQRVDAAQLHAMARVARTRDPEVLAFVESFLAVAGARPARRQAVLAGLTEAMKAVAERPAADPLAAVDDRMPLAEAAAAVAVAEAEASQARRALLADSVTAGEAARLTRRSRQSLERFRRAGGVIALREGNQWRYPRWQFEPDSPGGIVAGLKQVLRQLRLSPAGAAWWLRRRHHRLGAAPIQLLRSGRLPAVMTAARAQGERV